MAGSAHRSQHWYQSGRLGWEVSGPIVQSGQGLFYQQPGGAVQRKDSYQVKEFSSMSLSWVQGRQAGRQWFLLGVQQYWGLGGVDGRGLC